MRYVYETAAYGPDPIRDLVLVMVNDFGQINIDHGRQKADDFLLSVAELLRNIAVEFAARFLLNNTASTRSNKTLSKS